jgi:hypothetical protein
MRVAGLSPLATIPWALACATVPGVLREPVTAGTLQRYNIAADTLAPAAARTFAAQGLRIVGDTVVGTTRLLVASRGMTLTSWGEINRAAITPQADLTEVRILSRPVNALDVFHGDPSPRLFQSLDRELRDRGLWPLPGDRVRLATTVAPRRMFTGVVLSAGDGVAPLVIDVDGTAETLAPAALARLWVGRGSYGHAKDGALVGSLLGAVIGLLAASGESSGDYAGLQYVAGFTFGAAAGLLVGGVTGAAVRTEVWSDLAIRPR